MAWRRKTSWPNRRADFLSEYESIRIANRNALLRTAQLAACNNGRCSRRYIRRWPFVRRSSITPRWPHWMANGQQMRPQLLFGSVDPVINFMCKRYFPCSGVGTTLIMCVWGPDVCTCTWSWRCSCLCVSDYNLLIQMTSAHCTTIQIETWLNCAVGKLSSLGCIVRVITLAVAYYN